MHLQFEFHIFTNISQTAPYKTPTFFNSYLQ